MTRRSIKFNLIYLNKIQSLTQENNALQNILFKQKNNCPNDIINENELYRDDNKKLYDRNKELNDLNIKYSSENQFFSNLLYRIMKYHISNINSKNIISEMLDINQRIISLEVESNKLEKKKSKGDEQQIASQYLSNKQQINDLAHKLALLDESLKNYEV